MGSIDQSRLRSSLGQPALGRLVLALRRRLELGRPLRGRMTLRDASDAERAAYDAILGRRPTSGSALVVDLDALSEALVQSGMCRDLHGAVEALTGTVSNRVELAAKHAAAWESVWGEARALGCFANVARLGQWLEEVRGSGLLKRLSGDDPGVARVLLKDVSILAAALPAGAEPLASLAARVFGDAHALDPGPARATLAVRVAAVLGEVNFEDHAEGRRTAWAGVGVLCDELSTPVIVFGLRSTLETPLGRLLRAAACDVEPIHISLRLLLRHPLSGDSSLRGRTVFACENPTVVALAVQRLGARCRPILCVGGQFATPALVLLRQLRDAGARVRYHGDFDPAGLTIARRVMAEGAAEAWRYGTDDYRAAEPGVPFSGEPGPTPWCPGLAGAMRDSGRAVHEEAVFDSLALDLGCPE